MPIVEMSFPNSGEGGLAKVQGFNFTTMVDASESRIIELGLLLASLFFPCIFTNALRNCFDNQP
jgi:hypothetical protein